MRAVLVAVLMAATPAEAGLWTAACQDQQVQYQQITGGEGFIHAQNEGGSYTTVKVKQSYLDAKMVCGSVQAKVAPAELAAVCANRDDQTIRVLRGAWLAKGMKPEKAPVFCQAVVSVN